MKWGSILRSYYNTDAQRQPFQTTDTTITHLGYWTDNGK